MARLKDKYVSEIAPALMSKFGYKSVMQIPKLDKVVVNVGCGDAKDNPKMMDAILGGHRHRDRPAPCGLPRQEERCELQAARGHAHRREGHPAGRAYV